MRGVEVGAALHGLGQIFDGQDVAQPIPVVGKALDEASHTARVALGQAHEAVVGHGGGGPVGAAHRVHLAARVVGISIGVGGILLACWAAWTLYHAGTTIKPHKGADVLVTTGPFKRLRNPIYVADIMLLLGAAEISKNVWFVIGAALFALLVTFLAILPEERHLEARFGEDYRNYKARSRRWL